jgi:hypothetical protein
MKNKPTPPSDSLLEKLTQADICCRDCGLKFGVYSVGVSSTWEGTCDVCGQDKPVTEVRDWGYLTKGINELKAWRPAEPFSNLTKDFTPERKAKIREQSKKVANYMETVGPIMTDVELEDCLTASYEQGEITLKLTEEEVGFLNECLDVIQEHHPSLRSLPGEDEFTAEDVALFESIEKKITELYEDNCVRYELSPAMKSYIAKYGSAPGPEDGAKWEVFRDAYNLALEAVNRTA